MESNNPECIPQNDLDCFYNKEWRKKHTYKNNKTSISNFSLIQEDIDKELYYFILKAEKKNDFVLNNLVTFRESYYKRADFSQTVLHFLQLVTTIKSVKDLGLVIKKLTFYNIQPFFGFSVMPSFNNSKVYVLSLESPSLTITEDVYVYNQKSINWIQIFEKTLGQTKNFLKETYQYTSETFVNDVIVLEILFSKNILKDNEKSILKTHNMIKFKNFLTKFSCGRNCVNSCDFWKIILKDFCKPEDYVVYESANYFTFLKKFICCNENLTMIKNYIVYCIIKEIGMYTSIKNVFMDSRDDKINEKNIFLNTFYQTFGFYLQNVYENNHLAAAVTTAFTTNKEIQNIFKNLQKHCTCIFNQSKLFSDCTKKEIIKKLQKMDIIVGKQEYSINLNKMPVLESNFYDNLFCIRLFYFKEMAKLINQKINRYYLSINGDIFSFLVNAYYDIYSNIVYIPTSIICKIFFNRNQSPIYNYGGMGSIIGHEIMHAFDENGLNFNYKGVLCSYWTLNDFFIYNKEISKIKNSYREYYVDGIQINSNSTISENFADIYGLILSLRTYIAKYVTTNNLTFNQKKNLRFFFERYSNCMRSMDSKEILENEIENDVHTPSIIRINVACAHIDEYYDIFNVKANNFNYIEPFLRAKLLDT